MNESASQLAYLRDPRLSVHAIDTVPVWLWAADASRIICANSVGAAIFGAAGPAVLARRSLDVKDPAAAQIARIADTLPRNGAPRLERLRGFGAEPERMLTCGCSRISLSDNSEAILVVAAEAAGPALSLEDRVQRLVTGIDAIGVFSADGTLFHASAATAQRPAAPSTLALLDADALATHALRAGYASGPTKVGALSIDRIGKDAATFLVATLAEPQHMDHSRAPQSPPAAGPPQAKPEPQKQSVAQQMEAEADVFAGEANTGAAAKDAPPPGETGEMPERRHPLRFVWQMDAAGSFDIESGDFVRLAGPRTAQALGRPWSEFTRLLGLDPQGHVAQAVASQDTWSGITIDWPVDGTDEKLTVELSGLPVFDRNRVFGGYRGFGVCRDARKISLAAVLRHPPGASQANVSVPADETESPQAAGERPALTVVPPAKNVVPFRTSAPAEKPPSLSPVERSAFRELAKELTSRLLNNAKAPAATPESEDTEIAAKSAEPQDSAYGRAEGGSAPMGFIPPREEMASADFAETYPSRGPSAQDDRAIVDRLPLGVLVYRLDTPLYANAAFLSWSGYPSVAELAAAGGLDVLFVTPNGKDKAGQSLTITSTRGAQRPAGARLTSVPWEGDTAHMLMLTPAVSNESATAALHEAEAQARELKSILNTATSGVLVLDREGRVLTSNHSAERLFGYGSDELTNLLFAGLFAPESQGTALDYLAGLAHGATGMPNGGEVLGRMRHGGVIPLHLSIGRIADGSEKFCAVFHDLTQWKKSEEELINARRQAERASSAKSEFLAKISHEIRTPLNSIIGFSEVMMAERFGPIANERYLAYLKDIHESGGHLVSLLNDLLDLSKIEAGKLELNFAGVNLNELTQQCVALMQPQANQEKIIIRTSLPPSLPPVMADARSVRQILLNLLSNSIKFTGAGGQVIISTALTDNGDIVLRVRDTGVGMSEKEIQMALEPFRQLATSSRWGSGGTGLGLPLTKALAEANRANFVIKSAVNAGTLVEVAFPPNSVLAA